MRTILRIMKTELEVLLFSPVAWILLVIFSVQVGVQFCDIFADQLRRIALGYSLYDLTKYIFGGSRGIYGSMLTGLYLYIPLLTMNLVSRELNSGSIKLLYSSPVSNFQIIIGKYLSVVVSGLILIGILLIPTLFTVFTIKDPDIPTILTALLGVYFTICAYGSIGLFMSTITKYPVVAVVGTLIILSVFNFIGDFGQEYDFVRDITYWLSIRGRSETFLDGMLCTTDILYFLLVIAFFISLSIIKLQGERLKLSKFRTVAKYLGLVIFTLTIGYLSSRPKMIAYYDATSTKRNTLSEGSQEVLKKIDSPLTMTTYLNFFDETYRNASPSERNSDLERFEKYTRFKPDMKMKYVYYYGKTYSQNIYERHPNLTEKEIFLKKCETYEVNPKNFLTEEEVNKIENLTGEQGRLVRTITTEDGRKAYLRTYADQYVHPFESQITVAFKTLVAKSPMIGFSVGHSERAGDDYTDKGYGSFANNVSYRQSLINQGFNVCDVSLSQPVPATIDALIIADPRSDFTADEFTNYKNFVDRGGNIFLLGEPKRENYINPLLSELGLNMSKGIVVEPSKQYLDDIVVSKFALVTNETLAYFSPLATKGKGVITPSVGALMVVDDKGFNIDTVLITKDKGSWVEEETTDFINEKSTINEKIGEKEKANATMLYLNRKVGEKDQRIFVIGDADCIANLELSTNRAGLDVVNFNLIVEVFRVFSYGEYPIETYRPRGTDDDIYVSQKMMPIINIAFSWIIPLLLLVYGVTLLLRRKRK